MAIGILFMSASPVICIALLTSVVFTHCLTAKNVEPKIRKNVQHIVADLSADKLVGVNSVSLLAIVTVFMFVMVLY